MRNHADSPVEREAELACLLGEREALASGCSVEDVRLAAKADIWLNANSAAQGV